MGLKTFLNSPRSKIIIALLLGFGLSTFFRKACSDKNCMEFKAPNLEKINGKMFEYNTKCYEFESKHQKCDAKKRKVTFA
jgi:hypothetical protein